MLFLLIKSLLFLNIPSFGKNATTSTFLKADILLKILVFSKSVYLFFVAKILIFQVPVLENMVLCK